METKRLLLREMRVADAPHFFELNANPAVLQYTGDVAFTDETKARQFIEGYNQYQQFNCGRWVVLLKQTNQFLGWCGLKFHPETGETDLGFRLLQTYWNKGYSTEAARECLRYGFQTLKLEKIIARVREENRASIAVLKKLGMRNTTPFRFDGQHAGWLYTITAAEWQQVPS